MKLPKSFDELTVGQYQEINIIIQENDDLLERHLKILACLGNTTIEEVEKYTPKEIQGFVKSIEYVYAPDTINKELVKRTVVKDRLVGPVLGAEKLSAGQVLTLKHLEKQDNFVGLLHEMLACLYVDLDKLGFPKPYDARKHKQMAKDMKSAKLGDVYGTLFFYSNVFEKSNPIIQAYLNKATQTINQTMPEVMEWARKNPHLLKEAGLTLL
jgi:hypothetical protein